MVQDVLPQNKISVSGLGDSSAISTTAANTNSKREQIFIKRLD